MFFAGGDLLGPWHGEQGVHGEQLHGLEGVGQVLSSGLGLQLVAELELDLQGGAGGQSGSSPLPQPVPLLWLLLLLLQVHAHGALGPSYHNWWRSRYNSPSPPYPWVWSELGAN